MDFAEKFNFESNITDKQILYTEYCLWEDAYSLSAEANSMPSSTADGYLNECVIGEDESIIFLPPFHEGVYPAAQSTQREVELLGENPGGVLLWTAEKNHDGMPDVYRQPAGRTLDGLCGITGVANMLNLYGVKKTPEELDKTEYRSWGIGLRRDKFAENMSNLTGKVFHSRAIEDGSDPLDVLKGYLAEGKPVAIQNW